MYYRFVSPVLFLFLGTLIAPAPPVGAAPPSVPEPEGPGGSMLLQAETLVYSERAGTEAIEELLRQARVAFSSMPDPALSAYWEARAILLLGSHLNHIGDTRRAAEVLPEGLDLARRSLREGEFSDGLRVLADLHAQMALARGVFYMVRHGDETKDAAARARELDPENIRALITVAGFYLNAPRMAGGDVDRGIERLEEALELEPENINDRFMILGWLADAHSSRGDRRQAREYVALARRIYPESAWLSGIEAGI